MCIRDSYGAAFVLMVGCLVYGLLFPTEINASASSMPAPPAVTMLSPIPTLVTIATNQPIPCYGTRYSNSAKDVNLRSGGGGGVYYAPQSGASSMLCIATSGGYQTSAVPMFATSKGGYGPSTSGASTGTKITSGLFQNWQYWQASVVMQLVICFFALALSAFILPPIRRFRLRRKLSPGPAAA